MINSFFSSRKLSRLNNSSRFRLFSTLEVNGSNLEKQIQIEKRKRNQGYFALDYLLDRTTYFDFFSPDTFEIAKASTYFALYFKVPQVTPELLLYSCFYKDSSISNFLKPELHSFSFSPQSHSSQASTSPLPQTEAGTTLKKSNL